MDAIFRDVDDVVANVKADNRVVNTIVRADSRDDHVVSARAKIELFEAIFQGRLIETVMGVFFDDDLARIRFQFVDKLHGGAVVEKRVGLAKESELGMILRPDRLNMDDLATASRKRSNKERIFWITGLSPGPCLAQPSDCISTMIRPVRSAASSIVRSESIGNLRAMAMLILS